MRTVIAVDLNTMKELADEEATVRSEKTDWSNVAYREEAVRRVEERRETQKMLEVWEARRLARLTDIENVAFGAMTDLYMATVCYSFRDHAAVGKLVKDAQESLAALQRYALAETTK
uniref:Uncharacterized protein n=1 Tax=Siphoviridae sp. ctu1h4 TaxID=2826499 RepID=A0A8S5MVZ3_9CAUD|nr:MAG TPA: hypothetical protein [Siphoviridae sp. ctu1h4]